MTQVLLNLGNNAIKFTHAGSVSISISPLPHNDHHRENSVKLVFKVKDTGIGIDEKMQKAIFNQFTQADSTITRHYGGSGLGLSIVEKLVVLMGGSIHLDSQKDKGSSFWFILQFDIADETEFESVVSQTLANDMLETLEPATLNGLNILSVDDSALNQQLISTVLKQMGASIQLAFNGQEALDSIESCSSRFDLILMDMQMPVMDGLECTRKIRQRSEFQNTPIIAMTANIQPSDKQACLEAGMNDFLSKPTDFRQLEQVLKKYLASLRNSSKPAGKYLLDKNYPGFDIPAALERLDNNIDIYVLLAKRFLEDINQQVDDIKVSLQEPHDARDRDRDSKHGNVKDDNKHSLETAARLLHLLYGSTRTLGAEVTAGMIKSVQDKIKSGQKINKTTVEELLNELAALIAVLTTIVSENEQDKTL